MRIRIYENDLDGKPMTETGTVLSGANALVVVAEIKRRSPFTYDLEPLPYMKEVLTNVGAKDASLPDDLEEAAKEFLLRMAKHGIICFEEEDPYPTNLMKTLEAIRQSGKTNMLDVPMVVTLALEMNEAEVANWVNTHHGEYGEIIFHGRPKEMEVK